MPYEDEPTPYANLPDIPLELDRITHEVIGAAIEVHRHLGPGLLEEAYHRAMIIELQERGIPFETQKIVDAFYKGQRVARVKPDLLVAGLLMVELKSVDAISPVIRLQVRTYIRIIHQPLGLLINFNVPVLKEGIRRIIDT